MKTETPMPRRRQRGLLVAALVLAVASAARADALLADAAENEDWLHVRALIGEHAPVNATQPDGATALHWAAYHDDAVTVQTLLAAGADAGAANEFAVTPLSLACVNGSEGVVAALLDAGADTNTTGRGGESALMTAARTGRTGAVQVLLARGAGVDATDRNGQTALMWAAADGHAEVVAQLLADGAARDARLKSGFTAFLFAARQGRLEVVRALLTSGANPNEAIETERGGGRQPSGGTSALLLAVENGHFELALELVGAGADPNDARSGFSPLHALTWVRKPSRGDDLSGQPPPDGSGNVGSLEFARRLVAAGADVNARLERGRSGLDLTGATPLLMAAKNADLDLMRRLVELGADPMIPNKDGATPLLVAAGLGCFAPDEEAGTEAECLEAVDYLLQLGADVNHVDANGESAMHGAAYKSLPKMVRFLADQGAKPEVWHHKNQSGWTPVTIAEGFRPGNFKPSHETLAALHEVLRAAGLTPPPPTPRAGPQPIGYDDGGPQRRQTTPDPKRRRTGAVQKLPPQLRLPVRRLRYGVRRSSAALGGGRVGRGKSAGGPGAVFRKHLDRRLQCDRKRTRVSCSDVAHSQGNLPLDSAMRLGDGGGRERRGGSVAGGGKGAGDAGEGSSRAGEGMGASARLRRAASCSSRSRIRG